MLPLLPARYHAYVLDQRSFGDCERPTCCGTVDTMLPMWLRSWMRWRSMQQRWRDIR
jgi:hypothetical protein